MVKVCKDCGVDKALEDFTKGKAVCKKCISKKTAEVQKEKRAVAKLVLAEKTPYETLRGQVDAVFATLNTTAGMDTLIFALTDKLIAAGIVAAKRLPRESDFEMTPEPDVSEELAYLLINVKAQKFVIIDQGKYVADARKSFPEYVLQGYDMETVKKAEAMGFTCGAYTPPVREVGVKAFPVLVKSAEQIKEDQCAEEIASIKYLTPGDIKNGSKYMVIYRSTSTYEKSRDGMFARVDLEYSSGVLVVDDDSRDMALKHICKGYKETDIPVYMPKQVEPAVVEVKYDPAPAIARIRELPVVHAFNKKERYVAVDWDAKEMFFGSGNRVAKKLNSQIYLAVPDHDYLCIYDAFREVYECDD